MAEEDDKTGPRDSTDKTGIKTATETSSAAASPPGETTGEAAGDETEAGPEDAAQDAPRPETMPAPEGIEDALPAGDTRTPEPAPPVSAGEVPPERPETAPEGAPDADHGADDGADSGADHDTGPASADPPAQPPMPEPEPAPTPETGPVPVPDAPAQPCAAGLFGKLPARGDFISRTIDRDLLRPLEDWLLPLVQTARSLLGDGWNAAWHHAPAWRFWIGPDILQGDWKRNMRSHDRPGAVTGVLLPSADRQGRHFPLVLVLADDHARLMPPPVLSPPDRPWYAQCDRLLEAARAGRDLAQVEAELSTLRAPRLPDRAADMGPLLAQKSLWGQSGGQGGMHEGGDVWTDIRMSDHHLAASCRSYWWTEAPGRAGDAAPPISVISLAGLPDAETFAFMLTDAIPQPQEPDPT